MNKKIEHFDFLILYKYCIARHVLDHRLTEFYSHRIIIVYCNWYLVKRTYKYNVINHLFFQNLTKNIVLCNPYYKWVVLSASCVLLGKLQIICN